MLSSEAKSFVGQIVEIEYADRHGNLYFQTAEVFDVGFLPLYGPCLILNIGEIRMDRVRSCRLVTKTTKVA